ncbi:MAG: tyrosine-type recombinase/integrase [Caldilineaceae bacterium]|nr:tyrosine-type recombinase/integrase [Caldilineaceae bacterium]
MNDNLGRAVERFLAIKYNRHTRVWYAKYLAPMAHFLGRERALTMVTRVEAEAYWQSIQKRENCWEDHPMKPTQKRALSPTTLDNYLRAARAFWNEMVRQRVVEYNPFDHLKAPKDTRPVTMKAITADNLRAIWQAALQSSPRDFAIITVMATAAIRAGELVSMDLSQLDLKQGVAWVKGKRGWRKVFLGKASVQAIQHYLQVRPAGKTTGLWLNVHGQPLTSDGVRQLVDRLAGRAQVAGRHNLHAFRHRAAQAWLDQGINAQIVAQALGHADVTVTLKIYGNQDDRRVAQAIRQAEMAPFQEPSCLEDLELEDITQRLHTPLG